MPAYVLLISTHPTARPKWLSLLSWCLPKLCFRALGKPEVWLCKLFNIMGWQKGRKRSWDTCRGGDRLGWNIWLHLVFLGSLTKLRSSTIWTSYLNWRSILALHQQLNVGRVTFFCIFGKPLKTSLSAKN